MMTSWIPFVMHVTAKGSDRPAVLKKYAAYVSVVSLFSYVQYVQNKVRPSTC